MLPRKEDLSESMDSPGIPSPEADHAAAPELTAQPQDEKQASAPARSRRKAAQPSSAETAAADSTAKAPSAGKSPARKKAVAPAAAEPASSPEPAELPAKSLLSVLEQSKLKKKERNETHDKDRVFIRKDLKTRLDALAQNRGKGFKTLLLNYGLEKALDELEQANLTIQDPPQDLS